MTQKHYWQLYYLEAGKNVRQVLTVEAEFMYEAYEKAERQLMAKDVTFLAAVRSPLKLQLGEM